MPGRPDFSQAGTEGGGQTVAVSNRPEIVSVNSDIPGGTASGGASSTEIYAPPGSVYSVLSAYLRVNNDSEATTGDHTIRVDSLSEVTLLVGQSAYNSNVHFERCYWFKADKIADPPSTDAQGEAINSLRATENSPITVDYLNDMDVVQDNPTQVDLVMEETSY